MLKSYVGITDYEWFQFLAAQPGIDEVNFWKPGGQQGFSALRAGEPFLFKLHAPRHVIVGGAFFAYFSKMPVSLAWDAFGIKNGARSITEMRGRIEKYRRTPPTVEDYTIGCVLLSQPFFFEERDWIPIPGDWKNSIVQGRTYDLTQAPGDQLWISVLARLGRDSAQTVVDHPLLPGRFGEPVEVRPRIGQGIFRVLVTDAYGRRCAMTGERTLPALDAAHILPFAMPGAHRVQNGLLLRTDLHRLFDRGYVSVAPDYTIQVSRRISEEYENGRHYYAMQGSKISLPSRPEERPDPRALEWHADTVFLK